MSSDPSDDNSTSAESSESEPTPTADDKTAAADNVVSLEADVETVPDEELREAIKRIRAFAVSAAAKVT